MEKTILDLSRKIAEKRAQKWVARGRKQLAQGLFEETLTCCRRSLSIYDDCEGAYSLMLKVLMPDDDYISILSNLHNYLQPETYVEIGVSFGKSLELVRHDTRAIGIDPRPRVDRQIKSRAKLYPVPSDEFFGSYNLFEELGTSRLSLAFIDGLHVFEQVLKDFINIERYANRETVILIHDCLPITRLAAARTRSTTFWCGDVWKIIPCLKKYRLDLNIRVIPAGPSGLGIVTNPDQTSRVLLQAFDQIIDEFHDKDLDYDYLDPAILANLMPNLIPNKWQKISHILF